MRRTRALTIVLMLVFAAVSYGGGLIQIPRGDFLVRINGEISPTEIEAASSATLAKLGSLEQPRYPTIVYFRATETALYLGFDCRDTTATPAVVSVRDNNGPVTRDDSVELVIAPTLQAEKNNYFHFAVNAAGVRYSRDMEFDRPVEDWSAAAKPSPTGWQAEMLIPFTSVRGRFEVPYWRGNVGRNRVARPNEPQEVSIWNQCGVTIHNYKKFGFFKFVRAPEPEQEDIEKLLQQLMELQRSSEPEPLLPVPVIPQNDSATTTPSE
ncbi:MAG: hypothetical protein KatS3mg130_0701 [Candidatus Sumerlaea sp.]|nr:MAG: hypothetical protein KatS3mg130_0701 [Candidatus Sumerlaea sp.]